MPSRIRVFISSTMDDLVNERAEIASRLESFNFEAVHAETLVPSGQRSWDRIADELSTCHVVVLILGDRYGWIPDAGPMSERNKSVTELEYDLAREIGIPVIPLFKELGRAAGVPTDEEALRRDDFRRNVQDWAHGNFRSTFRLASEAADIAGRAVLELLAEEWLRRTQTGTRSRFRVERSQTPGQLARPCRVPDALVPAVSDGNAVLLLGAGTSLAAGLPSLAALVERMVHRIREVDPSYVPSAGGTTFNAVAEDLISLLSRTELAQVFRSVLQPVEADPTDAHRHAARLFRHVVTTNFDNLLEAAVPPNEAGPSIVHLHGSLAAPDALLASEQDLSVLLRERPTEWGQTVERLRKGPLLAVGTSLRDPSLIALLDDVGPALQGWLVVPEVGLADRHRLRRWKIEPVQATADDFLHALSARLT